MKPRNQVSRSAIELIKRFEGYRRKSAQLPDGRWTIGHGHTQTAREGAEVSEQEAELLLQYNLLPVVAAVNEGIKGPVNQHQFNALASFAASVGIQPFLTSDMLRRFNDSQMSEAADALIS